MSILKQKYNYWLEREQRAEEYFNNTSPEESKEWLPQFQQIIVRLSRLICELEKELGRKLTKQEVLEGFKEV